jgi:hypothetical protein
MCPNFRKVFTNKPLKDSPGLSGFGDVTRGDMWSEKGKDGRSILIRSRRRPSHATKMGGPMA